MICIDQTVFLYYLHNFNFIKVYMVDSKFRIVNNVINYHSILLFSYRLNIFPTNKYFHLNKT